MKAITYSRRATRALSRLSRQDAQRLIAAINRYAEDESGDVVKLQGRDGYRLRVGGLRVIFETEDDAVHVLDLGHRGGVYG
jgi:mRNA interferase RelE/StbE